MQHVEQIACDEKPLAYIIRAEMRPAKTTFVTPPEFKQQVGFVVYPAGGAIQRHDHRPLVRHLVGTSEVLVVQNGRCEIDIYNDNRQLVATRELRRGDIMVMVGVRTRLSDAGGHSFSGDQAGAIYRRE